MRVWVDLQSHIRGFNHGCLISRFWSGGQQRQFQSCFVSCCLLMLILCQGLLPENAAARPSHRKSHVAISHAHKQHTQTGKRSPKTASIKPSKHQRLSHVKKSSSGKHLASVHHKASKKKTKILTKAAKKPKSIAAHKSPPKLTESQPPAQSLALKALPASPMIPPPVTDTAPPNSQISPGVSYREFIQHLAGGPVQIRVLEIDPKTGGLEVMPVLAAGRMGSKANVANMVNRHQAVAGINGSFFKPDVGIPLGILMINQELISGPIFDRVALGITKDNNLVMDQVHLGGEIILPSGRRILLHNVNQPRVNANHTVIYSFRWGAQAPKVPSNGVQVLLENNHVTAVSTDRPLRIPRDGVVVSGASTSEMAELASLPPNKSIQMNVYTLPDWSGMKHAIGGGPWLVRAGYPYVDLRVQHFGNRSLGYREPRSAVGITRNGKMLLVAVDGRRPHVSIGMTLSELSNLMRQLGAVQAMNLDGGSSTQMAVYGRTVNRPSSGQIGVSNSLIVRQLNSNNMAFQESRRAF